jgi:hypothetical protein
MRSNTLFEDCGGPYDLTAEHMISCYENEPTTTAEEAIMAFLKSEPERYLGKRLLHVGVGNGKLAAQLSPNLSRYFGITISVPEKEAFDRRSWTPTTTVEILNKHDARMYNLVDGLFDLVIDINLKAFTCCHKHFDDMISFFAEKLCDNGSIITTETGLWFGWPGNTKRAFTPGAQTEPSVAASRVLGYEGLLNIARRFQLSLKSYPPPQTDVQLEPGEKIWVLTKRIS